MSLPFSSHELVVARSGGHCEAMIALPRTWTRCGRYGIEVHHALTRARGGVLLDELGETQHLIALCRAHHKYAHEEGHSPSGLMIDGSVYRDGARLIYVGPDPYLSATYGPGVSPTVELSVV